MKLNFLAAALLFGVVTYAQDTKTIKGHIYDAANNNEPLAYATIMLKNTELGAEADENGYFEIECTEGSYLLEASYMGYQTYTISYETENPEELNINLIPEVGDLDELVITINNRKSSETALLNDQRKSLEIKQQIGAQELSRKGVGDVAAAVAKTSGISKQEGSNNVYVRGLGDRYNSTTLNGLPVPSNDPEKKNINLQLFSTELVEYISIDKTFSSRNTGDFGGGNVDILSKDFKDSALFEIELGAQINTNATKKGSDFLLPQGPSKMGYANYGVPNNALSGYNFQNSLQPVNAGPVGGNFAVRAGKSFLMGETGKLNLFANASFNNGFTFREGINQSASAQGAKLKSFYQENFSHTTNTTGMFNANYHVNDKNRVAYNFLYINSSDLFRDTFTGLDRDFEGDHDALLVQRGTFIQNTVLINQLLGNHTFNDKLGFDWAVSYNTIKSDMPDRTQNKLFYWNDTDSYTLAQRTITDNHRYFQNLKEDELATNLALNYKLGADENGNEKGKLTIGYNGRVKKRDFEAIQFNFRIAGAQLSTPVNPNNLDAFFNQQNYTDGLFGIEAFAGDTPQTYSGEQNIHAGFANVEYRLTDKLSAVLGLRYEKIDQSVIWRTQLDAVERENEFKRNEFLPNLSLKYELSTIQNLRLAASKTYTLPQFKERARFIYEDVTEIKVGNPYLYPSQNYNLDLKWELFPNNDEVVSVAAFGKYILDPINEITMASSTNDITWVNIGEKGYVYGAEFEIKKRIIDFGGANTNNLFAGLNVSYMKTDQEIDREKIQKETNGLINTNFDFDRSSFTGASDLLLNADVSYVRDWNDGKGMTATVSYMHYSDRLYALGVESKGNLIDKGMGTLDFVLKTRVHKNFAIDFAARNILNPEFRRIQDNASGAIDAITYKRGAFFSLGAKYTF
ncbi:TonB-dependent receptor [Flavobacterium sp. CBA20B-1]|uniref:TonB-dependent receptor n=1 Tax=unclassified Flavobacterium TaxID=196869 RepID=UPI002224BE9A|nr:MULTISPECIES: TonB-dependent receptor [unclassified Flavobacterium]WCM40919.1 TonB-dependent receptor [Flavobacterium sp. CBA20B-1]